MDGREKREAAEDRESGHVTLEHDTNQGQWAHPLLAGCSGHGFHLQGSGH